MIAETMQQVGLLLEERNQHPDDEEISDHVQFFSGLSGQLAGVKVLVDNARESFRMEKELEDLKAELAASRQRSAGLEELRVVANRTTEPLPGPRSGTRIPPPSRFETAPNSSTAWRASLPGSRSRWRRPWNRWAGS